MKEVFEEIKYNLLQQNINASLKEGKIISFGMTLGGVGDDELVKDLTQDTFIKAMQNLDQFQGLASEKTWLMKIARNSVYDYFRRKKILKFIPSFKRA